MLHEILLSLSGQPSPLFNSRTEEGLVSGDAFPLLSPPEKALLASLARLSRLHARLRAHTTVISSSHASVICRSVSTAISTEHLGAFQKKILEVEKAILVEDSGYVGGYGIVPLSTIVGEFSPWTRRLEWLWEVVRFILPDPKATRNQGCAGAALIDRLRAESQTGYVDIEEMALHLVRIAETAWMRQLSTWLLYGNVPVLGKDDFFIQEDRVSPDTAQAPFILHTSLLPKFVSPQTASSILFIGKTLNLIRAKRNASTTRSSGLPTYPVTLQGEHVEYLAALQSPISSSMLSNAIDAIRLSLSQSTLSKILPLPKILEILSVLHDFLLLRRGEFAMALVSHADVRLQERPTAARAKAVDGLGGLSVKDGDVMATLGHALSELYSLQSEEDPVDDALDLAKDLLRLSVGGQSDSTTAGPAESTGFGLSPDISHVAFDDLLFPAPTCLSVQVGPPLDLFLSTSDISVYSKVHAYLLGIRRAQIRLSGLWKHTFLRRNHPSPWGPPRSNSAFGQNKLSVGRQRDNARTRQMRPVWATSSASLFLLSEIGSFFQAEVIQGSWQHFQAWIEDGQPSSPTSSRPGTASSAQSKPPDHPDHPTTRPPRHDPETLTVAHRRYLFALVQSLFLTDVPFTQSLRSLLKRVDHFVALVIRLQTIQRNMDLETDEGVVDALADYAGEETELWQGLRAARGRMDVSIREVVARLRDIDDSRSAEGREIFALGQRTHPSAESWSGGAGSDAAHYVPRKTAGVDRLLMKLDFGNANGSRV